MEKAYLQVKSNKLSFHRTKVEYLGFIILANGIHIDPKKTQIVQE